MQVTGFAGVPTIFASILALKDIESSTCRVCDT